MSRISSILCGVAVIVASAASGIARAEITTWDAYADFHTDHNLSTDTWQYIYQEENGDLISGNFETYGAGPFGYDVWGNSNVMTSYHLIGKHGSVDSTGLVVHPNNNQPVDMNTWACVIGWKSPVDGVVNVNYSVIDLSIGSEVPSDGVSYKIYKSGSPTILASGSYDDGGATGPLTLNNLPVAVDDLLCIEIGAKSTMYYDLTGVAFTVTAIPEPATMVILASSLFGLLAYAWRRRR